MQTRTAVFALAAALLVVSDGHGQTDVQPPPVQRFHLAGPLHAFRCAGQVHAVASVGDDGVLLVDTGYGATAEALEEAISDLGGGSVRIVVNTHGDADHAGGNAVMGKGAVIVAHPYARHQMSSYFSLPAIDDGGWPDLVIESETTLYFNGEAVRLIPVPGGHTGGDVVVHFTGSGVACVGDLILGDTLPNADPARGGDARRLAEVLRLLVTVLPPETRVVAAHGRDADRALHLTVDDLAVYADLIEDSVARVRRELAAGRSLEKIVDREALGCWSDLAGAGDVSVEGWTAAVYASITGAATPSVCAPVTEALVADGIEAAVAGYWKLRGERPGDFDFGERQLNALGYQLLQRGRLDEAIAIFALNVEAFPEAFNAYDSLGEAYATAGHTADAIAAYQRSIELNPDNANGVAALARLRGE